MRFDGFGAKPDPLKSRPVPSGTVLEDVDFIPNPGNLRMFQYLPPGLKPGAALVVTLHGCGQTAAGYDLGAGWCQLAQQWGFAVLAPEQKAVNNPHTCFDWFNPEDITRGSGEADSIAGMVRTMVDTHGLDGGRVFITGLSAGGAMTSVMLATYPELFAGGAIIAGLPFGAAQDVRDALESMRSAPLHTPAQWGDMVRAASDYHGRRPKISVWHGALDTTVNINNAQAIVAQWADLHGLSLTAAGRSWLMAPSASAGATGWSSTPSRPWAMARPSPHPIWASRVPSSWRRVFPRPGASRNSGAQTLLAGDGDRADAGGTCRRGVAGNRDDGFAEEKRRGRKGFGEG